MRYSKEDVVIFTVASNDYLIHIEKLLVSANVKVKNALFYVYLINVDKIKSTYLEKLYPNIVIVHEYIKFSHSEHKRGYCANLRARIFPELMRKHESPVVWVDADSMFMSDCKELVSYSKLYDLSVDYSEKHNSLNCSKRKLSKLPKGPFGTPYYGVFNTAVMFTNNSKVSKEFFDLYAAKVARFPLSWYSDQEGLYLSYREYGNSLKFKPLEWKYCDRHLKDTTVIWTAKGGIKESEMFSMVGEEYLEKYYDWNMSSPPNDSQKFDENLMYTPKNFVNVFWRRLKGAVKIMLTGNC